MKLRFDAGEPSSALPGSSDDLLALLLSRSSLSRVELPEGLPVWSQRIVEVAWATLAAAGMPLFDRLQARWHVGPEHELLQLLLPTINGDADSARVAFAAALRWLGALATGASVADLEQEIGKVIGRLRRGAPAGINSLRFLRAAFEAGIPWRRVFGNVFQFGWGRKAHWLDSTLTEATASISVGLARDKFSTANVLRAAGVPVPRQTRVKDVEEAVAAAKKIGFPVVVKPVGLDGGVGVMSDLRSEASVRWAFGKAVELSRVLLVEEHIEGCDYRLQVFRNVVHWVIERTPGGVVGDGVSSIVKLLRELNAERRPDGLDFILHPIALDDEATGLLEDQGLVADAIPERGRFVRLRRSANVANGGIPKPCLDKAHPDNLALAIRAAQVLRLDAAGIDLLIPDIAVSWRDSVAAICEVNAQPQLSIQQAPWFLRQIVEGQGRIPFVIVLGQPEAGARPAEIEASLAGLHGCVGVATRDGIRKNGVCIAGPMENACLAGQVLLGDAEVDLGVLAIEDIARDAGSPVDRLDVLVLAGPPAGETSPATLAQWASVVTSFARMCNTVLVNEGCELSLSLAGKLNHVAVQRCQGTELAGQLSRILIERQDRP